MTTRFRAAGLTAEWARRRVVAGMATPGEGPVRDDESGAVRFGKQPRIVLPLIVGARGAQSGESDGVVAALGGEVAAESEHVRPLGEAQMLEVGELAQAQAGANQAAGMVADSELRELVGGRDAPVERSRAIGGLGGVLGDVSGDLGVGQLTGGG